jgi:hypothetical protein
VAELAQLLVLVEKRDVVVVVVVVVAFVSLLHVHLFATTPAL